MRWLAGFAFDMYMAVRFVLSEMGAAIDRALDVWGDD